MIRGILRRRIAKKLNKVQQCPGSAPADRFMRTGIDGDNISKTPLQEAAGGCWCDGKVMKYMGTGAHGAQWASSMVPHSWKVSGPKPLTV